MAVPDKIRVLIVDDITETRENIRRMLQFDQNLEIIGEARTGKEAIEMATQKLPEVIVMDINMPDMDGLVATETIRKKHPHIQIIILSVQYESGYMRRAMLAGARDFLTKPPLIDELTNAIRQAGKLSLEEKQKEQVVLNSLESSTVRSAKSGKIIVVYSPKGGVGCTTIATNLAIALQSEISPTVIVDGNLLFGDVAVFLNEQGRNTIIDLAPRADELDPDIIDEVLITHSLSNIKLLASPPRPEFADDVSSQQFLKIVQYLQNLFEYIIVDSTPFLTDAIQSAIDIANVIVLVATQDIPSIKSANSFLSLSDQSGINRKRILFVLNRYDKRIAITPERISESLKQTVEGVIPLEERIVTTSINRGVPFIVENKSSMISKSIYSIAEKVKDKIAIQIDDKD
ncbi:MAG TPA: response regulator [Anaerolineaceae bacterium]|nr:response regulator [Anaerolineaceae bacterium]